jgi:hypothetical protein
MAARYGKHVLEYAKALGTAFTTDDIVIALDLTGEQARRALRNFADDGRLIRLGTSTWQHPDNIDTGSAREAREASSAAQRAATPTHYDHVDKFIDGAHLLRADTGQFFRAYLTELD